MTITIGLEMMSLWQQLHSHHVQVFELVFLCRALGAMDLPATENVV